ncbi:MAG: potassium channel family protein [Planctomycetota bacterium]
MNTHRRWLVLALVALGVVVLGGTIGYGTIADLPLRDAIYQTVITVTTVGYTDLAAEPHVRPFTTVLAALGAVNMMVVISLLTVLLVEEQVLAAFGRRKVERQVDKLAQHAIVCGYGRFGRTTAGELQRDVIPLVVLENDPEEVRRAREDGYVALELDATEEETLTKAGIGRARALLTMLGSDADNVYVILTAKQGNPGILVISVARSERAAKKLQRAGADRVISPYLLGAAQMARIVGHPTVADFLDMATGTNPLDFFMEEQVLSERSALTGSSLRDSPIRSDLGIIVVAVRRADGAMLINPAPDTLLSGGDTLVSLGPRHALDRLERMAESAAGPMG